MLHCSSILMAEGASMSRLVRALLALNALVLACSPVSDTRSIGKTPTPTRPSSANASSVPSPSALPDPASFEPTNPVTPGFVPRTVAFLDADHGVIGGKITCQSRCRERDNGILAVTDDGGRRWRVTKQLMAPITHLTIVPGTRTFWATASRCDYFLDGCGRRLLRSPDGGRTWAIEPSTLLNPGFASASVGFSATGNVRDGFDHGPIAFTRDGGTTWSRRPGPCNGWQNMPVAFSFPSASTGWLLCGSREPGAGFFQFKAVYRTVDAGDSWQPMTRSSPDGSVGHSLPPNGGALGIRMFEGGTGYVWAGGGDNAYLMTTIDGGATWRAVWDGVDGGGSELASISWLDPINAYAIRWRSGFGFDLLITHDGGASWSSRARWPVRF
jgi:photosystem II stability/assembly factor-like uncharacterized protein